MQVNAEDSQKNIIMLEIQNSIKTSSVQREAYVIPMVSQLKLVPRIPLIKRCWLVMSLNRSRDCCVLCKSENNFWWNQRKLRMVSPINYFCQKTFLRKFQGCSMSQPYLLRSGWKMSNTDVCLLSMARFQNQSFWHAQKI